MLTLTPHLDPHGPSWNTFSMPHAAQEAHPSPHTPGQNRLCLTLSPADSPEWGLSSPWGLAQRGHTGAWGSLEAMFPTSPCPHSLAKCPPSPHRHPTRDDGWLRRLPSSRQGEPPTPIIQAQGEAALRVERCRSHVPAQRKETQSRQIERG